MGYDNITPAQLIDFLVQEQSAVVGEVFLGENPQRWNAHFSNATTSMAAMGTPYDQRMGNIRWATELTRFKDYPNCSSAWEKFEAELHFICLEMWMSVPGGIRMPMLPSTSLICYTNIYKDGNKMKECANALLKMKDSGVAMYWDSIVGEDDTMFDVPARVARRAVFGKGTIKMCQQYSVVRRRVEPVLLGAKQPTRLGELRDSAEEIVFELNQYADKYDFNWKFCVRKELLDEDEYY